MRSGRAAPDNAAHTGLPAATDATQTPTRTYETEADYIIAGTSSTRLGEHNAPEGPPKGRQCGVTGAVTRPSSGSSATAGHDLIEGRPFRPLSASRYNLHWLDPRSSDLFTRFPFRARRRRAASGTCARPKAHARTRAHARVPKSYFLKILRF